VALSLLADAGVLDRAAAAAVTGRSTAPVRGGGEVGGELRSVV
jgi:hypothetical protein